MSNTNGRRGLLSMVILEREAERRNHRSPSPRRRRLGVETLILSRSTIDISAEKKIITTRDIISMFRGLSDVTANPNPWVTYMNLNQQSIPSIYIRYAKTQFRNFWRVIHGQQVEESDDDYDIRTELLHRCARFIISELHCLNKVTQIWVEFLLDLAFQQLTISTTYQRRNRNAGPPLPTWRSTLQFWQGHYCVMKNEESKKWFQIEYAVLDTFFHKVHYRYPDPVEQTFYEFVIMEYEKSSSLEIIFAPFLIRYLQDRITESKVAVIPRLPLWNSVRPSPPLDAASPWRYYNKYKSA
jgi:hypothetical protein